MSSVMSGPKVYQFSVCRADISTEGAAMKKRNPFSPTKTKYPGVYFILGTDPRGKVERILYISYRREGKQHFEKAGREFADGMTAWDARRIRADKIRGRVLPNREEREAEREAKAAHDARWTIGKIAEEYFTRRERQKTVRVDRNLYKRALAADFLDKTPEEIDPLSLDRFRKKLSQRKSTKDESKPRVASKGKEEDLSPAQLAALLAAVEVDADQDAADVVRLALFTGARREEILRLRWPEVDFTRGLWMLRDRKAGGDTGFPLSSPARAVLAKRYASRSEFSEHVFPGLGKKGYLRDPRAAFDRIKTAAGLPSNFRLLHGCRHHFATALVAAGVDMVAVARLLGHRDAQMVMRTYSHVRPGVLAQAAELSGKLIAEAAAKAKQAETT
jgi:integrase